MVNVDYIVIHCSATKETQNYSFKQLKADHLARGFKGVGYHLYIKKDGSTLFGRSFFKSGAHVKGFNYNSIGICYEGGLDKNGKPKDTRTVQQKQALLRAVLFLKGVYPNAKVKGHRDFSPDLNGDGIITPNEYIKSCPCFNVEDEFNF